MYICSMRYVFLILVFLHFFSAYAQVCEGSLGANIFADGDFGSGPQATLLVDPGYAPGYRYVTRVPADGEYTITKTTSALAGLYPSWLSVSDNSPNRDEYFMVVNASFEPGLFYQEVITDLCENTLYEFSADVINLIESSVTDHLRPNVDFLINGQSVFSTGDIPQTESWITYGFTFVTEPNQTTLTLSLRNNAPGGRGNDLGLDNITFRACGPSSFVGIDSDETTFLCFDDDPVVLIADVADASRAVQWQQSRDSLVWVDIVGATNFTIEHSDFDPGIYYYRYVSAGTETNLTNVKCRVVSDVLVIEVLPEVFSFRDTLCAGLAYVFGVDTLVDSGVYMSSAISSKGCDSTTVLELEIVPYVASDPQIVVDDPSCPLGQDGAIGIDEVLGGYGSHTWTLDSADQLDAYIGLISGGYSLVVSDRYGCVTEVDVVLNDPEPLEVSITGDDAYDFGTAVILEGNYSQAVDQQVWTDASGMVLDTSSTLTFSATSDQLIVLTVVQGGDCTYADTLEITVSPPVLPILPNAISPDGDGVNEVLELKFGGRTVVDVRQFVLYDRWGNLVEVQQGVVPQSPHLLWDGMFAGSASTPGTYTYYMELVIADGSLYQLSGSITLIR